MIELILGGARSGKSALAERLATVRCDELFYLATATADDEEMRQRIRHHQARRCDRNEAWQLIEEPIALARTIEQYQSAQRCILIDCLTLWMSNLLMQDDTSRLEDEKQRLVDLLLRHSGHLIMVSNEVGLGIVPLGQLSRRFVDEVGFLHQAIAAVADRVILVTAGIPQVLKGQPLGQ